MQFSPIARRVFRRLRGPKRAPAILMYHRVAALQQDPWDLAVSPDTFEQQLAYLKGNHTTMELDKLVQGLRSGKLPDNAVAITFDDGYRDNLVQAKPLLAHYGLSATLFLATGWVGSSVPFWWDELAEWTLLSRQAVDCSEVIEGKSFLLRWDEPETADSDRTWRASCEPRSARQKAYLALWRKLWTASQVERTRVMASLRGTFQGAHDPLSLPMGGAEIQELIRDGLVTIGAHTVHHPALTGLSMEECREEVVGSAEQCRRLTGLGVSSFAYPYGDMNEQVRQIVAETGFVSACSTRSAHLDVDLQDMYAMPRLAVQSCGIAQFAALLGC
jgi:peptidoglycan/xylan/chitin deacetylase (PgdA/CDA1 family)